LTDEEPKLREAAIWTLGKMGDKRAVRPLISALEDKEPKVREAATWSLGKLADRSAVEPLINGLADEEHKSREAAAYTLGKMGDRRAVEPLIYTLEDKDLKVRAAAAWTLGKLVDKRAIRPLIKTLGDGDPKVREAAAWALERLDEPFGQLVHLSLTGSQEAMKELAGTEEPRALKPLIRALQNKNYGVRRAAALTLVGINDIRAIDGLVSMGGGWHPRDRIYGTRALTKIKQNGFLQYLFTAFKVFATPQSLVYFLCALFIFTTIMHKIALPGIRLRLIGGMISGALVVGLLFTVPATSLRFSSLAFVTASASPFFLMLFLFSLFLLLPISPRSHWLDAKKDLETYFCRSCLRRFILGPGLPWLVRESGRLLALEKEIVHHDFRDYFVCRRCRTSKNRMSNIRSVIAVIDRPWEKHGRKKGHNLFINVSNANISAEDADWDILLIRNVPGLNYNNIIQRFCACLMEEDGRIPRRLKKRIAVVLKGDPPLSPDTRALLDDSFRMVKVLE
jgi:HEAT repeat protein